MVSAGGHSCINPHVGMERQMSMVQLINVVAILFKLHICAKFTEDGRTIL
jgi:hypothetical protein